VFCVQLSDSVGRASKRDVVFAAFVKVVAKMSLRVSSRRTYGALERQHVMACRFVPVVSRFGSCMYIVVVRLVLALVIYLEMTFGGFGLGASCALPIVSPRPSYANILFILVRLSYKRENYILSFYT
jgi:hypothetical protein